MIKKLTIPFFFLIFLISLNIFGKDVIIVFELNLSHHLQDILFNYVFPSFLGLGSAWFIERFIMIVFWENNDTVHKLLKLGFTILLFVITILSILNIVFQQSIIEILTGIIVICIILAFLLHSFMSDIVASLAIRSSYKVGDWIGIPENEIKGCIVSFNWRVTLIKTQEDRHVLIPNQKLREMVIINYKKHDTPRRQTIHLTLDFPTERIFRTLLAGTKAVLGSNDLLENPPPKVLLSEATSAGIQYMIWYWIKGNANPDIARHIILNSVIAQLKIAGLSLNSTKSSSFNSLELRVTLLAKISLFNALDEDELNNIAVHLQERLYREGDTIVKQGAIGKTMFLVAEGLLYIFTELDHEEHKVKVGQIISGQFFGEMSLLTGQTRSATVIAATDTIVYEIAKENIFPLLSTNAKFSETISDIVAARRLSTLQTLATSAQEEKGAQNDDRAKHILAKMRTSFNT
ncbi:MAG: mechanosensitive ion channel family protein [Thiomargarita sp.]|nr:mechanosensitive ion channel family protein [Thiomargarita sp.]